MAERAIRSDEQLTFFPTYASLSADGKHWHVPIHGWIYEPATSLFRRKLIESALASTYDLHVADEHKQLFSRRVQLLLADNERSKEIRIHFGATDYVLPPSEKNGHMSTTLTIPKSELLQLQKKGVIRYTAGSSQRRFHGRVHLIPEEGVSVISDIDDTIKISSVLNRKELLRHTFYEPFQAVPGMADFYQWLERTYQSSFHYVSSSPWHLYDPLQEFVSRQHFPPAEFILKEFRYKDKTFMNLFKKGSDTKPQLIRSILKRFPKRSVILIGDSGEEDPEAYAQLMTEFPDQIVLCLIRNITNESLKNARMSRVFGAQFKSRVHLFETTEELPALVQDTLANAADSSAGD